MTDFRRLLDPPCLEDQYDLGYTQDLLDSLSEALRTYPDIYRVKSPSRKNYTYVINHPQYVKHVLQANHKNYRKGIGFDRVEVLLGNGLIVSDGELWKRQRQMIQPAFHKKVIASLTDLIVKTNQDLCQRWLQTHDGVSLDIGHEMSKVTLHILLSALFSEDLQSLTDGKNGNPFDLLTEETERNLLFAQKFRALGKVILKVVNDRRYEDRYPSDLVGMMMTAVDKITGKPMSDRQLLDEIFTMIIAGHETTATSLTWIWHFLYLHPEVEARLNDELSDLPESSLPDLATLSQMPFTSSVINEALRLYPSAWIIPRRSINEDQLGDYHIPAGSDIFISPYFLHRDARWWKDPEEFRPERFMAENASELPDKHCYIPFSVGPRKCIGDFLAMVEMKLHLAVLIPKIKLKGEENLQIELEPQINLRSKHPILMEVHRKSK